MTSMTTPLADAGEWPRPTTAPTAKPTEQYNGGTSMPSLDALGHGASQMRAHAGPALHELAEGAGSFAQDGLLALRRRANRAGEAGIGYVRANPLQSVLLAAGTGALLAMLLRALGRAR
jgi:ElaB/YqjD/DUF883 family membrane-anchored ribosome-binding protein